MAVSFVDQDMIMRHFGGGVGHLKNTPPQQVHRSNPFDPDSEEMEVEDEEGDAGCNTRGDPQDIVMSNLNGELEVGEDDEEKGRDENNDENDDDDDESDDEDEDDSESEEDENYGYSSP